MKLVLLFTLSVAGSIGYSVLLSVMVMAQGLRQHAVLACNAFGILLYTL